LACTGLTNKYFLSDTFSEYQKALGLPVQGIIFLENIAICLIVSSALVLVFTALASFEPGGEKKL
jgi:hypothetical protein